MGHRASLNSLERRNSPSESNATGIYALDSFQNSSLCIIQKKANGCMDCEWVQRKANGTVMIKILFCLPHQNCVSVGSEENICKFLITRQFVSPIVQYSSERHSHYSLKCKRLFQFHSWLSSADIFVKQSLLSGWRDARGDLLVKCR